MKIFIHEEDADTLHFSIPVAPSNLTELSDAEPEKVAGGTDVGILSLTVLSVETVVMGTVGSATATLSKGW